MVVLGVPVSFGVQVTGSFMDAVHSDWCYGFGATIGLSRPCIWWGVWGGGGGEGSHFIFCTAFGVCSTAGCVTLISSDQTRSYAACQPENTVLHESSTTHA